MDAWTDRAPRQTYGPRALLPGTYGSTPDTRLYGKGKHTHRGIEALPPEVAVLCPNRVKQQRIANGYESAKALTRAMDSMSYLRLNKIEIGRVIVRDSEYELIADALGIETDDLKLPLLSQSETSKWNDLWGPESRIEEGGDHDSVLLSAYVRKLVADTGGTRTALLKAKKMSSNTLCAIWYASKPIDRYPDSVMAIIIGLSRAENWDTIILRSRAMYESGELRDEVAAVQEPRIRYAPEDPDRRAPWTYETDPLRVRKARRMTKTPLSARPTETKKNLNIARIKAKPQVRLDEIAEAESRFRAIVDQVKRRDLWTMLHETFPESPRGINKIIDNEPLARTTLARAKIIRQCNGTIDTIAAANVLNVTTERIRQIGWKNNKRVETYLPSGTNIMETMQ